MLNKLLLPSVISFLGYFFTNRRPYKYTFKTFLDNKVKLVPIFVIPYLLLFPYIGYTYFSLKVYQTEFLASIIVCNLLATVFWYLFPNGVKRKLLQSTNIYNRAINLLYKLDGDTNGFPSGHVFLSITCTYYLYLTSLNLLYVFLGFLISISTVFIKQHYVVDMFGGIIWAVVSIMLVKIFIPGLNL